jgi:hypothetical protein
MLQNYLNLKAQIYSFQELTANQYSFNETKTNAKIQYTIS